MAVVARTSTGRRFKQAVTYGAAVLVLVVMAFPLYGIILTSIQTEPDIRSRNVAFVPTYIETEHYRQIFAESSGIPVAESMVNSLVIALATALLTVAIAVPAAYALHRMPVPGKRIILGGLAAIYVLPTLLFVLPLFIAVVQLDLYDTYIGLVLPYVAFTLPFMVWIMRSFVRFHTGGGGRDGPDRRRRAGSIDVSHCHPVASSRDFRRVAVGLHPGLGGVSDPVAIYQRSFHSHRHIGIVPFHHGYCHRSTGGGHGDHRSAGDPHHRLFSNAISQKS